MYIEIPTNTDDTITLKNTLLEIGGTEERNMYLPIAYFKNRKTTHNYITINNEQFIQFIHELIQTESPLDALYSSGISVLGLNTVKQQLQYSPITNVYTVNDNCKNVLINNVNVTVPCELENTAVFCADTGQIKSTNINNCNDVYTMFVRTQPRYTYKDIVPLTLNEQQGLCDILKYKIKNNIRRCEGILWCQANEEIQQKFNSLYNRIHNTLLYWVYLNTNLMQFENTNELRTCGVITLAQTNLILNNNGLITKGIVC